MSSSESVPGHNVTRDQGSVLCVSTYRNRTKKGSAITLLSTTTRRYGWQRPERAGQRLQYGKRADEGSERAETASGRGQRADEDSERAETAMDGPGQRWACPAAAPGRDDRRPGRGSTESLALVPLMRRRPTWRSDLAHIVEAVPESRD
jgi:hypothetical protein